MIRDLEGLLLNIVENESREYMQESVKCYNAGAYRAAVVLSFAAGMDRLRKQLLALANSRIASSDIVAASNEINRKYTSQNPFEHQLIEACETHASLLTPAEARKLMNTLNMRNSCAHPSGHMGSPEEARDAIATVVDMILSREALLGNAGVSIILERMSSPSFFPDNSNIALNKQTVEHELRNLHPNILNLLVTRLTNDLRAVATQISEGTAPPDVKQRRANFTVFLSSLLLLDQSVRQATWKHMGV